MVDIFILSASILIVSTNAIRKSADSLIVFPNSPILSLFLLPFFVSTVLAIRFLCDSRQRKVRICFTKTVFSAALSWYVVKHTLCTCNFSGKTLCLDKKTSTHTKCAGGSDASMKFFIVPTWRYISWANGRTILWWQRKQRRQRSRKLSVRGWALCRNSKQRKCTPLSWKVRGWVWWCRACARARDTQ